PSRTGDLLPRLCAAAKMLGEELFTPTIEVELVFRPSETVPLVRIDYVGHVPLCFTQRGDHRVSISHCDSRIVLALHDQKRSPDRIDMKKRRDFPVPVLIVIGVSRASPPARQNVRPVTGRRTKAHGFVGWPKFINTTRKEIRPADEAVSSRSSRSEEHTSELQSRGHLVCRLLLEKKRPR